ncbi:MAG: hypothetical protein RL065_775 [Bacteroidota bacterium]|jgi:hypothetical protein
MKANIIFFITIITFGTILFACQKKNHICNCTTTDSLGVSTTTLTTIYGKTDDAKKQCEGLSKVYNGKSTICHL